MERVCFDCNDPDPWIDLEISTPVGRRRVQVCGDCADERGLRDDDGSETAEAVDYERDGGTAA